MVTQNSSSSEDNARALARRFIAQQPIGALVRHIDLALDNARLAPRVRQDLGVREVHIDIANGVSLRVAALASYRTELVATASHRDCKAFGHVLAAIRSPRLREQRLPVAPRAQAVLPSVPDYTALLARLGIDGKGVDSFVRFADAINASGVAIVTPKARQGAEECVYRKPLRLAQTMVDVILRTRTRTHGCCDQQLYGTLPGFRLNLSDSQRGQFRSDYVAVHAGCEHLGQLHVTLGVGHSPARCASVHWAIQGVSGPVVFTRIGQHGRNAST